MSLPSVRHCFGRLHELQRVAGSSAEAHFQWAGRTGGLYLVSLPDQQQWLLRNMGISGSIHDRIALLSRTCITLAPITPVATTTPTTSSPPTRPTTCLSEEGKHFGANMNPVVNQVVGGWQASTIVSTHSGFPLAVYGSGDATGTGSRGARPDCGVQQKFGRSQPAADFSGYQWMSPSGFSDPAPGTFGNCPAQGPVNGPGYFDADIGLMKNFHFTEAHVLAIPQRLPERL